MSGSPAGNLVLDAMTSPSNMSNALLDAYVRYINTPFSLRYESLSEEREALLREPGNVFQKPYVELLPGYEQTGIGPAEAVARTGLASDAGEFVELGLFGGDEDIDLFSHQTMSLDLALTPVNEGGGHVVVTSGTGSGKTECFLMPIISRLVEESADWSGPPTEPPTWWRDDERYQAKRESEDRPAAMRALVLYPLNALVEDQMVRLREALDSDRVTDWLDRNRDGHRFYFGAYNSRTPTPGVETSQWRQQKVRDVLQDMEEDRAALSDRPELVPNPAGPEMVVRWDMQNAPPDILVTNFSMLKIMLMRQIEESIFEKTRDWLASDDSNTFILVVDELHSYRGTAGTEISLTIRLLLDRLGLSPNSDQLRIVATSASLEDTEEGRVFLEEFFGCDSERFEVLEGEVSDPPGGEPTGWEDYTEAFARFEVVTRNGISLEDLDELADDLDAPEGSSTIALGSRLRELGIPELLVDGASEGMNPVPISSIGALAERIYPGAGAPSPEDREAAVAGMVLACAAAQVPSRGDRAPDILLPSKTHIFFKNLNGIWACSDPDCPEVDQAGSRPVGKLYCEPRMACECGSRVLDLHYCQTCGEVFLGGHTSQAEHLTDGVYLTPAFPEVSRAPDFTRTEQNLNNYTLFWASTLQNPEDSSYPFLEGRVEWGEGHLDPTSGMVWHGPREGATEGWLLRMTREAARDIPARPRSCPHCGDRWRHQFASNPLSPVRGLRPAFTKVGQVLADRLLAESGVRESERKIVAFSDSRREAANTAMELENYHYLDLLRNLLLHHIRSRPVADEFRAYQRRLGGQSLGSEDEELATQFEDRHPIAALGLRNRDAKRPLSDSQQEKIDQIEKEAELGVPVPSLWDDLELGLVEHGMNPAGIARWANQEGWADAYDTAGASVSLEPNPPEQARSLRLALRESMVNEAVSQIFAGRDRGLEDLGFGFVTLEGQGRQLGGLDPGTSKEVADSALRVLGQSRHIRYRRDHLGDEAREGLYQRGERSPDQGPPRALETYLEAVADAHNIPFGELEDDLRAWLEDAGAGPGYLLTDDHLFIETPENPGEPDAWVCTDCRQRHLHASAGVCTSCGSTLPNEPTAVADIEEDYYAQLALDQRTRARLRCEELTGQTDVVDSFRRLRKFKGIMREDEDGRLDPIDLLSVTTTMEAGVDIGDLRSILMANMPPERFNYQQRAGRCGRRKQGVSYVLTLCKGRSHDDYYFTNLEAMTSDPPPAPYLDMDRGEIVQRVLASEVLRRAFRQTGQGSNPGDTDSVHGEFGPREDWPDVRGEITSWINANRDVCENIVDVLSEGAPGLQTQREGLASYVTNGELVRRIDEVYNASTEDHLSQALAWEGLLPMFGFPTALRNLHLRYPRIAADGTWEEETVDRPLDIAISEFAPGAELPKDKETHRCIGIADWTRSYENGQWNVELADNLLGDPEEVSYCRNCLSLHIPAEEICPRCHQPSREGADAEHGRFRVCYPKAFRTDFDPGEPRPGEEERTYGSSARPVLPPLDHGESRPVLNTRAWLVPDGDFYTINDRNRGLFRFHLVGRWGWLEENQLDRVNLEPTSDPMVAALADRKQTEALVVEPADTDGSDLQMRIADPGVRSCLYSFGFLLRRAAAEYLDTDRRELEVGIAPYRRGENRPWGRVFLADDHVNGAGYARYLAAEGRLRDILEDIAQEARSGLLAGMRDHLEDPEVCDTSCYNCLMSYQNRRYHPLLNWRLGMDTARLLAHGEVPGAPDDDILGLVEQSIRSMGPQFSFSTVEELPVARHSAGGHIGVFSHPLLTRHPDRDRSMLVADAHVWAEEELRNPDQQVVHFSYFDIVHRPWWVAGRLADGRGGSGDPPAGVGQ